MDKEMLDIVNDLSKKPTTELALQIMELSSENLILEQQCKKQKEVIEEVRDRITIKLGRYINEKDYVIDDVVLDELLQILDKAKDSDD